MVLDHVLDLIGAEHGDDDAARGLGQFGDRADGVPADLGQSRAPGRIDVETDDGNMRVQQALGVDLAHQAQTDNGNGSSEFIARLTCRTSRRSQTAESARV